MLNPTQQQQLDQLLASLSQQQTAWVAGYLQGLVAGESSDQSVQSTASTKPVHIYYATETGNSKVLTLELMKALKSTGIKVKNSAVNRLKLADIKPDNTAIFIASTHGEGDPPAAAVPFYEQLQSANDNALKGLDYIVLGLGDSSYKEFCAAATILDFQLTRLGGSRLQETALFDVDYQAHTPSWITKTVSLLSEQVNPTITIPHTPSAIPATTRGYSRLEPITGMVTEIVNLNDIDSDKETYHIALRFDEPVQYQPGDAAGIILPGIHEGENAKPRLYSIASSQLAHEDELHLTVARASYMNGDATKHYGLYSNYLSQLEEYSEVTFYIQRNQLFKLPEDDRNIIMIGPGTGVAPFRAFVQQRAERGGEGRNWLFFGDRQAHCDFLYQAEWQEFLATDGLHRLDVAFSRDQAEKVYVQHKLQAAAQDVLDWLDGGANIYVCGDKHHMAKDVDEALTNIIAAGRNIEHAAAANALAELAEQGRYFKDVY